MPDNNMSQDVADFEAFTLRTKNTIDYFATVSTLRVFDDFSEPKNMIKYDQFWAELKDIMQQIQNDASLSIDTSDISRFNELKYGESMPISKHTANMLKISKEAFNLTEGLFDPTIYPLIDLWAFSPRFNVPGYNPVLPYDRIRSAAGFELPDEKYIEGFTYLVDFNNVLLTGDEESGYTVKKNIKPVIIDGITYEAKLDLGGIAKGYAVDITMAMLKDYGYDYGFFSSGRSSIGLRKSASKKSVENGTFRYELEIRKPRKGNTEENTFMSVAIKDSSVSSSGDYDHNYELDGKIYTHIIDGYTGYPMNSKHERPQKGIATVTVFGESAAMCDAISTAICLMDINEALEYVNRDRFNDKIIIVLYHSERDYYEVLTNLDSDEFVINDDAYILASSIDDNGSMIYTGNLMD
jgi:thiamine biosynthesis lipoprotein